MKKSILVVAGIICVVVGIVVITYAIYPVLAFKYSKKSLFYETELTDLAPEYFEEYEKKVVEAPKDNRLVIPKIGVDAPIVEGQDESVLWQGVWRHPSSAFPGEKGNVAISGHRFQFRPPHKRTFYLLNELWTNDYIIVYFGGKEFDYKVSDSYIISPDETKILEKGDEEKLTLYTCTPLFTQTNRLVVEAKPFLK